MAGFSPDVTRRKAVREFLGAIALLSLVTGTPLYFFVTSPVIPEPWKSGLVTVIAIAWLVWSIGLVRILRRNLTPVRLLEVGIQAGRRFVPYADIVEVDPQPGVMVFGLRVRDRRLGVYLSKIGVADESAFFEELNRRIMGTRRAAENGSSPGRKSVDIES